MRRPRNQRDLRRAGAFGGDAEGGRLGFPGDRRWLRKQR